MGGLPAVLAAYIVCMYVVIVASDDVKILSTSTKSEKIARQRFNVSGRLTTTKRET
jgi:hypothetical protein